LRISYLTTETLFVLKDILRKYPEMIEDFAIFFNREIISQLSDDRGQSAFVWIVG